LTPRRYDAYRSIRAELDRLTPEALADPEKKLLHDVAEGLLLARPGEDDAVEELRTKAAVALSLLVGLGRWNDAAADRMWAGIVACGPLDDRPSRHGRAVQHA
jgi:hypothetical protein